jgi:hypothetical protein
MDWYVRYRINGYILCFPFPPLLSVLSEFKVELFREIAQRFQKRQGVPLKRKLFPAIFGTSATGKGTSDLIFVRFFIIQLLTEQGAFDMALNHVRSFYFQEPTLHTVKKTIWWMQCIWNGWRNLFTIHTGSGSIKKGQTSLNTLIKSLIFKNDNF